MRNEDIQQKLKQISSADFSLSEFRAELQKLKEEYVARNDQAQAKQIWIFQTVLDVHINYQNAFALIQAKSFYQGWCQLEQTELSISWLKRHFPFDKTQYELWFVERTVKNLQIIFPYKMFGSSEILKKKKKCSTCDKEVSIRNFCGHVVGEIYDGEMCHRIVTEAELLGMAFVENPGNKYSVAFLKNDKTGEQQDHYNYDIVEYLFDKVSTPYEWWDLEISQRTRTEEVYPNTGRNDLCPCGSNKKYKKCCGNKIGEKYPHYDFRFLQSTVNRFSSLQK